MPYRAYPWLNHSIPLLRQYKPFRRSEVLSISAAVLRNLFCSSALFALPTHTTPIRFVSLLALALAVRFQPMPRLSTLIRCWAFLFLGFALLFHCFAFLSHATAIPMLLHSGPLLFYANPLPGLSAQNSAFARLRFSFAHRANAVPLLCKDLFFPCLFLR